MIKVTLDHREGMHPVKIDFGYGLPVKNITAKSATDLMEGLYVVLHALDEIEVENFLSGGMDK